jgi:xanthine/uracil permease
MGKPKMEKPTATEGQKIIGIDDPVSYLKVLPYGLQHFTLIWGIPFGLPVTFTIIFSWFFTKEIAAFMISAGFITSGIMMLTQNNRFSVNLPMIGSMMIVYMPVMITAFFMAGAPTTFLGIAIGFLISTLLALPSEKYGLIGYIVPIISAPPVNGSFLTFLGLALIYYVTIPNIFGRAPYYNTGWTLTSNVIIFVITVAFILVLYLGLKKTGKQGFFRSILFILAIVVGIIVAAALGRVDFSAVATAPWFAPPRLFLGLKLPTPINVQALSAIIVMSIIANFGGLADLTGAYASADRMLAMSPKPIDLTKKRTNRGVFFWMLWNSVTAFLGGAPNTCYPQHMAFNEMSGVWSTKQTTWAAILMIISGLIYKVGMFGASIPPAVLAGTTLITMGMCIFTGFRIISRMEWTDRNMMTVGFSIGAGMLCLVIPSQFIDALPYLPRIFFGSAILVTLTFALLMYIFLTLIPKRLEKGREKS